MKPRSRRHFPRTLMVCMAPLLAFSAAQASLINFNEQSTTNAWTFATGTNLLASATVSASAALGNHGEGTSTIWAPATDGLLGLADGSDNGQSVSPANGTSVTYALDLTGHATGYDITSFDAYGAWGNTGRDNLDFTIEYSTVANPTTFVSIGTVSNHTPYPGSPLDATHTTLTDTTGFLATGVHSIRLNFNGQENSYVGYREFILRAAPVANTVLNESSTANVWTFPAGSNLLRGSFADPAPTQPVHGGDVASGTWATVTNNSVGTAADPTGSVTPNNQNVVTFPLDISTNFNGYNLTSFDSYCAWANSGRDNQDFSIRYSTVDAPDTYIPLGAVVNHTSAPQLATHTRIAPVSGFLATRVAKVQFYFNEQENGYTGYREFIALGSAVSLVDALTWTGGSGSAGNADWIDAADSNWKKTDLGTPSNFNPLAALTFDNTGANRNITVPTALTASSLTFTNTSNAYTLSGQFITVSNDIVSTGSGSATFNNSLSTGTGITLSGAGNLVFNSDITSPGLILSGTGSIDLNASNPDLTGNVSVSNGTLNANNDYALQNGTLTLTGGIANFTTSAPQLDNLAGTGGSVVLGYTASPVATDLSVGAFSNAVITSFTGNITQAAGDTGRLTKVGGSSLSLGGTNTYTGPTHVVEGTLEFSKEVALYGGGTGSWTASNILVDSGSTLGFKVGSAGEFTDGDLTALNMGGFQAGSTLGINTTADFTLSRSISAPVGVLKKGASVLTLTGANSHTGSTTVIAGTINAANPTGISLPGNVILGDGSADIWLNFGANDQFGPTSVLTLAPGPSVPNAKVNLRGTNQTVAGLESADTSRVSLIQNDEIGQPGYTVNPGPATLTINTASNHSYHGIIRNQDGGAVTVIKNGPATQEFGNLGAAGYYHTGGTIINDGTLKVNFRSDRNTNWSSNINIASSSATLELVGNWNIFRTISGPGKLVKTGTGQISVCNTDGDLNANTFTGGTVIQEGTLKFYATNGSTGEGNVSGEFCPAGPMDPSNVIQVKSGATLGVGAIACFGESALVPAHGVTINIEPGGRLWGADGNNIAFVPNVHLDGATVEVTTGSVVGGFNTNMTFVGTVVVGSTGGLPSTIFTPIAGDTANISLGSVGLPGTVFDVADATASSDADLVVNSILRDVINITSPLVKTGPGTMALNALNTYTGDTTITGGELLVNGSSILDSNKVVINGGKLAITAASNETVGTLYFAGVQQIAGTYGSTASTATFKDDSRFSGSGTLTVTTNPITDPYVLWSAAIPNPGDRDKTADPDGDGFSNLQEYLFGTSPVANTGSLYTMESTGATLIVRWNERASATYLLQESSTLLDNPWPTSSVIPSIDPDQTGLYSVDYTRKQAIIPVNSSRKFVRVQASE